MKVIFLSNDTVEEFHGGAQLNTRSLVDYGKSRGHDVSEMTVKTFDKEELLTADLVVLVALKKFEYEDIRWVLNNCTTIKNEMDYAFCKFGNCKCFGKDVAINKCGECNLSSENMEFYEEILDKVKFFVFFTPGQRNHWRKFFGEKVDKSHLYLQFYSDDKIFHNMGLQRIVNSVLWVGRFSKSKGIDKILKQASQTPQAKFFFVGKASTRATTGQYVYQIENLRNCTYLGQFEHDKLPVIYNLCEKFIYDGHWPDTGPATVIEAALCGCEILTQPKIATILTNDFKDVPDIRSRIRTAKKGYWERLEKLK